MNDNKVELIDENGDRVEFEHLMTLEYMGNQYLVLHPSDESVADDEVVIMSVDTDDDGEEFYEPVDDEDTANKVFMEFLSILEMEEE